MVSVQSLGIGRGRRQLNVPCGETVCIYFGFGAGTEFQETPIVADHGKAVNLFAVAKQCRRLLRKRTVAERSFAERM